MEECSLDLIFFKIRDGPFIFLVWGGAVFFFNRLKLEFFSDKAKSFIFYNHRKYFTFAITPYTHV